MLEHGASITASDNTGTTVLSLAIEKGKQDIVYYLKSIGASLDNDPKVQNEKRFRRHAAIIKFATLFSCTTLSLAHLGTSIYLRESHYASRPQENPAGTINSFLSMGLMGAISGAVVGNLIVRVLWSTGLVPREKDVDLDDRTIGLGILTGLAEGLVSGYFMRNEFNRYPGLYYSAPAITVGLSLGLVGYELF